MSTSPGERTTIRRALLTGDWFSGLPGELQRLILAAGVVREYARGDVLQREDGPSQGLIGVLQGRVSLSRFTSSGAEALLWMAGPGFWFGEIGLFTGNLMVTGTAQAPVRALVLPKADFERIVTEEPRYYRDFARMSVDRCCLMLRFLAETLSLAPGARLRIRLADIADMQRREHDAGEAGVVLDLSQAELGHLVGLSRQKLNARLRDLQDEGWIELGPRRIRVLDPDGLRATAAGALARGEPAAEA